MYDLIGDIHGHATELERLLAKLGYTKNNAGVYQHPKRKVIFLGDFIDRGGQVREVLQIAKSMTEAGTASSVMGNHEFNILSYYTQNSQGAYLRPHTPKNQHQIAATLAAFKDYPAEWKSYLDWMQQLPLWLDLGDIRVIHACWHPTHIAKVQEAVKGNQLTLAFLQASSIKDNWEYESIEILLKGMEIPLPNGQVFYDKDGHERRNMRIRWWQSPKGQTLNSYGIGSTFPEDPTPREWKANFHYAPTATPVFIGHYWLKDQYPRLQSPSVCCLDYSVAKNGQLVAYRWNKVELLSHPRFVSVSAIDWHLPNPFKIHFLIFRNQQTSTYLPLVIKSPFNLRQFKGQQILLPTNSLFYSDLDKLD